MKGSVTAVGTIIAVSAVAADNQRGRLPLLLGGQKSGPHQPARGARRVSATKGQTRSPAGWFPWLLPPHRSGLKPLPPSDDLTGLIRRSGFKPSQRRPNPSVPYLRIAKTALRRPLSGMFSERLGHLRPRCVQVVWITNIYCFILLEEI